MSIHTMHKSPHWYFSSTLNAVLILTFVIAWVYILSRVFRTMFKEFKPSSGANRLSSPLLRRRIPTVSSHQYMSPQNTRKSRIPGIGRMKKKRSVPEGLARVGSSESSAMPVTPFCEENLQIKEQVSRAKLKVCVSASVADAFKVSFSMKLLAFVTYYYCCRILLGTSVSLACS